MCPIISPLVYFPPSAPLPDCSSLVLSALSFPPVFDSFPDLFRLVSGF